MIKDSITRLVTRPPADKRLDPARNPDAIRSKTGLERKQAGNVETQQVTVESTDGLFTFIVRVVKS